MKKSLLQFTMTIALILLICFAFSCQREAGPLSDDDVAAIKASTEAFIQAVRSEDWAAHAALYTEDAVWMPPNQPIVQGREAIQTWMEEFPTMTEFNLTAVEIDGYADIAYVRGTYSLMMLPEGALEPIRDTGKFLEIRRKQPDGSWPIAVDIFNSDLPLPEQLAESLQKHGPFPTYLICSNSSALHLLLHSLQNQKKKK